MLGPHKILGVSCKTPAQAAKAQADGADYIGVGAVYPTGTKAASVIGIEGLRTVCELSGLPVVAIGGVGAANTGEVLAAGADGLAVVSAVFAAPDVEAATRELCEAVTQAQQQQQQQCKEDEPVAVAMGQ
jgi:thiamine-phosphate diphosphorylase